MSKCFDRMSKCYIICIIGTTVAQKLPVVELSQHKELEAKNWK